MKTSKILFGLALALGITATAFASTTDVSPVDKSNSQDTDGKIYASGGDHSRGYFWTNLGYAQIKDSNGNPVELYTPFIYHTYDKTWDSTNSKYNPVHDGDDSEMECKETMGQIYVGEFDRIIKALYHNDLKVYNAINGGIDQETGEKIDGLRQKAITKINSTVVNNHQTKYEYLNDEDKVIGTTYDNNDQMLDFSLKFDRSQSTLKYNVVNTNLNFNGTIDGIASTDYVDSKISEIPSITDTDTRNTFVLAHFEDDILTFGVADTSNNELFASVTGVASIEYVNSKFKEIPSITDTNTKNTSVKLDFSGSKLSVGVKDSDGTTVASFVDGIASVDFVNSKFNEVSSIIDTNTKNSSLNVELDGDNTLTIGVKDSDGNLITGNVSNIASTTYVDNRISEVLNDLPEYEDTNTVTTISGDSWISADEMVSDTGDKHYNLSFNEDKLKDFVQANSKDTITTVKGSGLATVTNDGNHNYTVDVSEDKVKEIAKSVDTNTMIDSITSDRDSGEGVAKVTIKDTDGNSYSTEITDVASHKELKNYKDSTDVEVNNIKNTHNEYVAYNEGDKYLMKQDIVNNSYRISGLENKVSKLDSQVKETGAMSAALAGLHPRFADGNKGEWLMSIGHYKGKTAYATGLAYAPDEQVMFTLGGSTVGGGDYMFNMGATFALDRVDKNKDIKYSRREVDQIISEVKAENAELRLRLAKLEALLVK